MNIVLYGASGHGKVIWEILESNGITPVCVWDDADKEPLWNLMVTKPGKLNDEKLILSIGDNRIRKLIACRYGNDNFTSAIHRLATISIRSKIGVGTVVMANAVLNADSIIGVHCILNTASVVEHDCSLGDFVHLSPHATLCGNVTVGEGTHIGAGAVVIPSISIGKWCTIGAGTVIIRDVPDGAIVVGSPGRISGYK